MTSAVQYPLYSVKFYRDNVYKLVKFKRPLVPRLPGKREGREEETSGERLSQSLSRTRSVIFQLAFCNDWDFFFTGTIDPAKYNRYQWKDYYTAFTQWLRDYRKKYHCDIKYMFVPELHKDGAVHIHGFVRGIPQDRLRLFIPGLEPQDLVNKGYLNWPDYQKKFGFCSLGSIENLEATAHYVTKYITEDLGRSAVDFGGHLHRESLGLNREVSMGYVYQSYAALDVYLDYDAMFCSTGWVRDVDWSFWLQYIPVDAELPPLEYSGDVPVMMSNLDVFEQLSLFPGVK